MTQSHAAEGGDLVAVTCRHCGAPFDLNEEQAIFAYNIGYADPAQCGWLCMDCASENEELADAC